MAECTHDEQVGVYCLDVLANGHSDRASVAPYFVPVGTNAVMQKVRIQFFPRQSAINLFSSLTVRTCTCSAISRMAIASPRARAAGRL